MKIDIRVLDDTDILKFSYTGNLTKEDWEDTYNFVKKKFIREEEDLKKQNQICANCGKPKEEHFIKLGGSRLDEREMCFQDSEKIGKFKPIQNPSEMEDLKND